LLESYELTNQDMKSHSTVPVTSYQPGGSIIIFLFYQRIMFYGSLSNSLIKYMTICPSNRRIAVVIYCYGHFAWD